MFLLKKKMGTIGFYDEVPFEVLLLMIEILHYFKDPNTMGIMVYS